MAPDDIAQIDILLATYNGESFLEPQIESILAQSYNSWRLIVRDDGSNDRTLEILTRYCERFPEKIIMLKDDDGNVGCTQNFSRLMEYSNAPYAALCDQDDVWLPDKIALSLEKMQKLEAEHGKETPLLVFSDLTVVDADLGVVSQSYWHLHRIDPRRRCLFSYLLLQNVVTGCTAVVNRPLRVLAAPIPPESKVHDWWIGLVATAFGVASIVDASTILYRQHGKNSIGVERRRQVDVALKAVKILSDIRNLKKGIHDYQQITVTYFEQAQAFLDRFRSELQQETIDTLEIFLAIPRKNFVQRAYLLFRYRFVPYGLISAVAYVVFTGRVSPR
jgi:glycosyltransferase involved in cell wall biosynthesis